MKKALSLTIATVISSGAMATTPPKKTEELIITAARTEQTLAQTLSSVTLFTRADIEKYQANSLSELLSKTPGTVITRTGGRGSVTSLSLRGNQSDHTLFLVDGIRVGSSTLGSTALEQIDPELIERIEIVRGPKSSLYGSDALGGVINIITRRANGDKPLTIKTSIGNNGTQQAAVSYGQHGNNYQASITASYRDSDGIDNTTATNNPNADDDGFDETAIGFNGAIDLSENFNLALSYQWNEGESEYDNNCTNSTTFLPIICSPYSDTENETLNLSASWNIGSIWTSNLSAGFSTDESETLADDIDMLTTFSGGEFNTEKQDVSWVNNIQINQSVLLTLGYDYLNEKVSGTTDYDVDQRDNEGYFAQLYLSMGQLSANISARNDDNEQFGNSDTFTAMLGLDINDNLKLIASYGEAFKAPTFNDLYFPNFGDPTFKPEQIDAYELTIRGSIAQVDWSVTTYRNNIEDLIQYNADIFASDQISSATIDGWELTLNGELAGFEINSALTLLNTEDDLTGNELARRPKKTFNLDIDKRFGKWSVGTTWYVSSSRFNAASNSSELAGYGTIALRSAYRLNDEWKLQLKADNLFEKDYVLAQASSFSGLGNYQQPGLEVLFSVVYTPRF